MPNLEETKSQSGLKCYLALEGDYELAKYLFTVRDRTQRQILTKYRQSGNDTEMHFLLQCKPFNDR